MVVLRKHKLPPQAHALHSNLRGNLSSCVWTLACNQQIMKHSSSTNFAAVWDTFCLPPPQSCSHLQQLFSNVCATVCHTHLPFCSPFREISLPSGGREGQAIYVWVGARFLSSCLLFLECFLKILLFGFSQSDIATSACRSARTLQTMLQQKAAILLM